MYQQKYQQAPLFSELAHDWPIMYYKEGLNALITIRSTGDAILMRTNGKTDASTNTLDMRSQLLAAYLPMMIKPDAKKLLVIGLGSGITAGTLAQIPNLESMDCIEIEKSVAESAKFFEYYNKNILQNHKVNIYIEDGKSFLKSTKENYDIISVHLSNPWIAGIANLFTVDAYELMKSKLNKDGIVLQWFHTYRVSPDLLRMVIRTFAKVFPYYQMWSEGPSIFLIGGNKPLPHYNEQFFEFANKSDTIKKDLRTYFGIADAHSFIAFFISENGKLKEFIEDGELNTDDKPLLEFELPKYFYFDNLENWNWQLMIAFRNQEDWLDKYFHMSNNENIYYTLAVAKSYQGFTNEAMELIERGLLLNPDSAHLLSLKAYIVGMQNPPAAMDLFNKALMNEPNDAEIYYRYAIFLLNRYSPDAAIPHFRKAEELGYSFKEFWLDYASALTKAKDYETAISILKKGLPYADDYAYRYYEQIGLNYTALRKFQDALDAYKKASEINPYYSLIYARAADIYLQIGMYTVAENFYTMAINMEPSRYVYYLRLAEVYARLGRTEQVKDILYKAYLLTPNKLEIYNTAAILGIKFP
jgi:spermidine synthase/Tfp pilus assembly protein PilF